MHESERPRTLDALLRGIELGQSIDQHLLRERRHGSRAVRTRRSTPSTVSRARTTSTRIITIIFTRTRTKQEPPSIQHTTPRRSSSSDASSKQQRRSSALALSFVHHCSIVPRVHAPLARCPTAMATKSSVSAPPGLIYDAWRSLVLGDRAQAEALLLGFLRQHKLPSLADTLANEDLSDRFMTFLEGEYCAEQLVFVLAVREFRAYAANPPSDSVAAAEHSYTSAHDLVSGFFDPCELNLSDAEKQQVLELTSAVTAATPLQEQVAIFNTAYHSILSMLVEPHHRFSAAVLNQVLSERPSVPEAASAELVPRFAAFRRRPSTSSGVSNSPPQASNAAAASAATAQSTSTTNLWSYAARHRTPTATATAVAYDDDDSKDSLPAYTNVPLQYRRR